MKSDCDSTEINFRELFFIDDSSDGCPALATYTGPTGGEGELIPAYVLVLRHVKSSNGPHFLTLEPQGQERLFRAETRCDNFQQDPAFELPSAIARVSSQSGALYDVTISGYANDAPPREIFLGDLVFTPV
jgi:hypothetical protein